MAHVEASTGFINGRIIPSTFTANGDFLQKAVGAIRSASRKIDDAQDRQCENAEKSMEFCLHAGNTF